MNWNNAYQLKYLIGYEFQLGNIISIGIASWDSELEKFIPIKIPNTQFQLENIILIRIANWKNVTQLE